jgi:predicted RNA-binding protein YlxR (DUF448 family)
MPKGFQKGHKVSTETREKISIANRGVWVSYSCDYCGKAATKKTITLYKNKTSFL